MEDELAVGAVRVGQSEGVSAQHRTAGVAEATESRARHIALVLFQTEPEECVTSRQRAVRAPHPSATPPAHDLPPVVRYLQDLQLKETRPSNSLEHTEQRVRLVS